MTSATFKHISPEVEISTTQQTLQQSWSSTAFHK